jgi:acyl-CoA synthetase (AMP-forming)/AMP-acid ligase II/acyl carrier protein
MNQALLAPAAKTAFGGGTPGTELVDWRTDTLIDLLRRRAADDPSLVVYTFLEDGESHESSLTAAGLADAARTIGYTLAKLAPPGSRVILLFGDGLEYIAGLFGCLWAGLVAVSGIHPDAPRSVERLRGILHDSRALVVLGHARVLADFQRALDDELDELDLRWVASDKLRSTAPADWTGQPAANAELALIQYTSGSTREPRGVMLSHRNVLHNLHGQAKSFGYEVGDTGVSWLPFSHDMGLIGCVLMAVYGGGRCVLLAPSHFLEDPSRWLRAISRYRATLSGGPNFAYELCAQRAPTIDLANLDLSSWTVAVSGAEPIRADVMRRFASTFAPAGFAADAIHASYGLAEATLLVATGKRLAPLQTRILDQRRLQSNIVATIDPSVASAPATELVGCGRGLADQSLAIVDPATARVVPAGEIGEIWVAGPSVSAGYFGRAEENAALFGGDVGDGLGPYLRTGDLGFVLDDELFITGRLRDLLVIRGKNYYPQDIEHSAERSHPSLRPAGSAAFMDDSGGLVVIAELLRADYGDPSAIGAAIRQAIADDHGISPRRVVLAAWGSVLKTPSGKVQRAQTRAADAQGLLAVVHESVIAQRSETTALATAIDPPRVEEWFLAKLRQLGIDAAALDPSLRLTELGFDSLKIVELKAELERDLGITVHVADLYEFDDIAGLTTYLRTEIGRKDRPIASVAVAAPTVRSYHRLAEQRQRRAGSTGAGAAFSL